LRLPTFEEETAMPEGLLLIRLALGLLLFAHGTQKLFGWYGGHGLAGTGGFFESIGFRPGRTMAAVAGISEAGGGLLLVLGLFTPLGAAMVGGTMLVAALSVHRPNGVWATNGGYELPLVYGVVAIGLAFTGAGSWSLDSAWGIPFTSGFAAGLAALVIAVVAGMATEGRRRQVVADSDAAAYPAEDLPADPAVADGETSSGRADVNG
jgi:putative oxidoreductase